MFVTGFGFNMAADNNGSNDPDAEAWVIKYTPPQTDTFPSSIFPLEASANRGQTVRILGNNLATVEEVFIGGKSASFTVVSSGELRVTVPDIGPGSQTVSVRTTGEIVRSDLFLFVN